MGSPSSTPPPGQDRVPVPDVLPGLELHPLEQNETAIEAFVLIKLLDAEGHVGWSYRTTNALNREELLGALVVEVAVLKKELRDEWDDDEDHARRRIEHAGRPSIGDARSDPSATKLDQPSCSACSASSPTRVRAAA